MKHLAEEWADALEASTYFSVLKRGDRSHDDFWRNFPGYDDLMALHRAGKLEALLAGQGVAHRFWKEGEPLPAHVSRPKRTWDAQAAA